MAGKIIYIIRQDEHREYDEAQRDAYIVKIDPDGTKYVRTDVQRPDGNMQTELTPNG